MSKEDASIIGEKRPPSSSPLVSPKKKKKLGATALRALAALESDSDSSSSSSGGDEKDAKNSKENNDGEINSYRRWLNSNDDETNNSIGGSSACDMEEDVVILEGETARTTSVKNVNDIGKEKGGTVSNGSCLGGISGLGDTTMTVGGTQTTGVKNANGNTKNGMAGKTASAKSTGKKKGVAEKKGKKKHVAKYKNEEEDNVSPHNLTSEYNNILSSFLSTPFDDKAMYALHKKKEGITSSRDNDDTPNMQIRRRREDIDFESWVTSQRDFVPIVPQKEWIKRTREEKQNTAAAAAKDSEQLSTQQNGMNSYETNRLSPTTVDKQVRDFLMNEGQNMMNNPLLSLFAQNIIANEQQQRQQQLSQHHDIAQPNQQKERVPEKVVEANQFSFQRPATSDTTAFAQQQPQQLRTHEQQSTQNQLYSLMANDSFGFSQQQQQQHSYPQMQMQMNTFNNLPQQQLFHQGYQHNINGQGWQYPAPFAAPMFPSGVANAYNNLAYSSMAANGPTPQTKKNIKVAMASKETTLTTSNKDQIAKLPLAFGFSLDDGGISKKVAQASTAMWYRQGTNAMTTESGKKRGTNKENNKGSAEKKGKKGNATPGGKQTPGKGTPSSSSTTPKTPKTPAILLSEEAAANLPEGWIVKKFQRTNGKTARTTDKYFYSPDNKIKFRSMKGCKQFIDILAEPGIDGIESDALKVYKERGYKF